MPEQEGSFSNVAVTDVLFLCTGNYFRSRFSEALLRHLCLGNPELTVRSAGLQVDPASGNVGPMAKEALEALRERGIELDPGIQPMPRQVEERDLEQADLIIAVDAAAHRPMVRSGFPAWENRIRFWGVKDLGEEAAGDPIVQLEQQVKQLHDERSR